MSGKYNNIKSNILKYNLFNVLRFFVLFLPIQVLFWKSNGLNMTQIMSLQSIFAITAVILEIPSGYFSDIHGRRKSIIISSIFFFFAIVAYATGSSYLQFAIAELCFGIAVSFISGSDHALLYDTLVDIKKEKQYKKILGDSIAIYMMSIAAGNIIGGYVGQINLRWTFYIMLPLYFLNIFVAISYKEPKRHKLIIEKNYMHTLLKILKEDIINNKKLRWIIIYSSLVYSFAQAALWLYQPYFQHIGLTITQFGFVFASFQVVAALSSKSAHIIENKIGRKISLISLMLFTALGYLLMSYVTFIFGFVFCYLHQFVRGFSKVTINDEINQLTNSKIRATVLSVKSMASRLIYAIIGPIVGIIIDKVNLIYGLQILGISTSIVGLIILIMMHKNKII